MKRPQFSGVSLCDGRTPAAEERDDEQHDKEDEAEIGD
jgi:hypothetical protein